jgi:predicted ATPase
MLVGRRLAVGALRGAVDTAVGGAGGVVLLAGEAGMGKTALAAEAVAYAKARGAAAVWGTCWEGGGAPGFWPWIQVVRALAADGDGAGEALLAELAGQAELIRLTGLTADEIGQLIEKVYGERPQAALIQAVHDRAAGNPFFAQQIARLLAAQGAPLDRAPPTLAAATISSRSPTACMTSATRSPQRPMPARSSHRAGRR